MTADNDLIGTKFTLVVSGEEDERFARIHAQLAELEHDLGERARCDVHEYPCGWVVSSVQDPSLPTVILQVGLDDVPPESRTVPIGGNVIDLLITVETLLKHVIVRGVRGRDPPRKNLVVFFQRRTHFPWHKEASIRPFMDWARDNVSQNARVYAIRTGSLKQREDLALRVGQVTSTVGWCGVLLTFEERYIGSNFHDPTICRDPDKIVARIAALARKWVKKYPDVRLEMANLQSFVVDERWGLHRRIRVCLAGRSDDDLCEEGLQHVYDQLYRYAESKRDVGWGVSMERSTRAVAPVINAEVAVRAMRAAADENGYSICANAGIVPAGDVFGQYKALGLPTAMVLMNVNSVAFRLDNHERRSHAVDRGARLLNALWR